MGSTLQPHDKLYIFEVAGVLDESRMPFAADFLGCWVEGDYSYLFFTVDHEDDVEKYLANQRETLRSKTVMDYSDWEAGRKLKPLRVGRLLVCPTWDVVDPKENETRILLEPGVAFGTGWHHTTNACLELLQIAFASGVPSGVLDLGAGTGILSIASVALGTPHAVGVDYNQMSLANARVNLRLNNFEEKIRLIYGDVLENLNHDADFLVANLYFDVLSKLLDRPEIARFPRILFSGLIIEFVPQFLERLASLGFRVVEERPRYEWYTCLTEQG